MRKTYEKPGIIAFIYTLNGGIIKYAIFKRCEGWVGWEILKGGVKANETALETAKREVLEEAGIKVSLCKSNHKTTFFSEKNGEHIRHAMTVFFGKIQNQQIKLIKLSKEHSEFKLVELKKCLDLLPFDNLKELILKINEEIINNENL
jgi:8-oxo-dGTP pyrophosphatase MutT (NUDIX family)